MQVHQHVPKKKRTCGVSTHVASQLQTLQRGAIHFSCGGAIVARQGASSKCIGPGYLDFVPIVGHLRDVEADIPWHRAEGNLKAHVAPLLGTWKERTTALYKPVQAKSTERICERIRNVRIPLPPPTPIAQCPSHRTHQPIASGPNKMLRAKRLREMMVMMGGGEGGGKQGGERGGVRREKGGGRRGEG